MTKDEALKLALEELEATGIVEIRNCKYGATKIIRKALAQPAQEPDYWLGYGLQAHTEKPFENATALYITPPKREWVGLTHQQTKDCMAAWDGKDAYVLCRAIEAKLKEKNT
jgi:hypothetical protein